MDETYDSHGIFFKYPTDWELTEREEDSDISITVQSPETSFWLVTLDFDRQDPEKISHAALEAFKQEYEDLDVYPAEDQMCDLETLGWDVEFRCLELYNTAKIRSFKTDDFSVLILSQGNDRELESRGEVLQEITRSLRCRI